MANICFTLPVLLSLNWKLPSPTYCTWPVIFPTSFKLRVTVLFSAAYFVRPALIVVKVAEGASGKSEFRKHRNV
jgi:hypothetical protein